MAADWFEKAMQEELTVTLTRKEMESLVHSLGDLFYLKGNSSTHIAALMTKLRNQIPQCSPATYNED